MIIALAGHSVEQRLCLQLRVDDAERLVMLTEPAKERRVVKLLNLLKADAAQRLIERLLIGTDLANAAGIVKKSGERRLRCTAEHSRTAMVPNKLLNRLNAWNQQFLREHLRFIKNDDAVCDIVQLSAAGSAVGIKRLKELHVCGDDDRRIPVFACE
ncbi:hypothetical protein SDC9_116235 [bioreactor metagenome]|uniref:Uncharacterized protein n=1 Tax=bioreactor metagenome TaxID=1076179 RepID=A0A645BXB1_9ZZZZ